MQKSKMRNSCLVQFRLVDWTASQSLDRRRKTVVKKVQKEGDRKVDVKPKILQTQSCKVCLQNGQLLQDQSLLLVRQSLVGQSKVAVLASGLQKVPCSRVALREAGPKSPGPSKVPKFWPPDQKWSPERQSLQCGASAKLQESRRDDGLPSEVRFHP